MIDNAAGALLKLVKIIEAGNMLDAIWDMSYVSSVDVVAFNEKWTGNSKFVNN